MSQTCCWPARWRAADKLRCAWPSAPRGGRSSCKLSRKASCSLLPAALPDLWSPSQPRGCCLRLPSRARIFFRSAPRHRSLVLAFAFGLALVTGIIFGAAPAWFATRTDPAEALRGSGRSTSDRSSFASKALLVVQATLSVVLVAGATMLARSLNKLEHQDFGYQVQGRVLVELHNPPCHAIPGRNWPRSTVNWRNASIVCPECRGPGWRFTTRSPTTGAN